MRHEIDCTQICPDGIGVFICYAALVRVVLLAITFFCFACGGDADSAADAAGEVDAAQPWSPWNVDTSGIVSQGAELQITAETVIDAAASGVAATDRAGNDVLVIAYDEIIIQREGVLRIASEVPVIVLADMISIAGKLEVVRSVQRCPDGNSSAALSGGRGGPGQTAGGAGGNGGAMGVAASPPTALGVGADGQSSEAERFGGCGGGALQAIARSLIVFAPDAEIGAHGSGGEGGRSVMSLSGGGGGGAGGMIVLDAPTITFSPARIAATGGGGGGGGGPVPFDGSLGQSGNAFGSVFGGSPGGDLNQADQQGGRGGKSGFEGILAEPGGAGSSTLYGGGGGGGGVGFIYINTRPGGFPSTDSVSSWSPRPQPAPL